MAKDQKKPKVQLPPEGRYLMGIDFAHQPDKMHLVLVPVRGAKVRFDEAITLDKDQFDAVGDAVFGGDDA